MKVNFRNKEELIANIQLSMAKKNEYVARIQREWAEQNVQSIQSKI